MLDSKNIMLDIAKASTSGPAGSAVQGQDNTAGNPGGKSEPFSALMGDAAAKLKAAKSGNSMPSSQSSKSQGSETSPEALLHSRTLKGGTALIVGGAEPTDEGLIAFAQAQGMDPSALGLLKGTLSGQVGFGENTELSAANDTQAIVTGAAALNIEPQSLAQSSPLNSTIQASGLTLKSSAVITEESKLALPADKFLSDHQRLQAGQSLQRADGLQPTDPAQNKTAIAAGEVSPNPKNPLPEVTNTINTLDIKPNSVIAGAKLAAQTAMPGSPSGQLDGDKMTIGPKIADAFIKQHRERQGLPSSKLEAINLIQSSKAGAVTSPTVISPAPPLAAGLAPAPLFIEGQAASSATATNVSLEPTAENAAEEHRQDAQRRQADFTQLSRQLTDALGKRLSAQIQRGSWHIEMELHPKTLGRVEVQLEMKNGELEARFIAANATTRDLINEGMPRLREAFQEHGTETAYRDLGAANQGASDGKSTASPSADKGLTEGQSSDTQSDDPLTGQSLAADGLDVLV